MTPRLKASEIKERKWLLFDAKGKTLGRFAQEIAKVLRGRHKVDYTPEVDSGDGVIVINAKQIEVTGNKEAQKEYKHYSGYAGGLKRIPYRVMKEKKPEEIIRRAVKGMMPISKQRDHQLRRLRVFANGEHNMTAQNPIAVNI